MRPQKNRNYKARILTLKVNRKLVMNLECPGQQLHQLKTDGFSQEITDQPPTFLVAAIDFYNLFLDADTMELNIAETNRFGQRRAQEFGSDFQDTTEYEMRKIFGICLQMGIVRLPRLYDYWSQRPALGGHSHVGYVMVRRGFEELLRSLHVANIDEFDGDKIRKFLSPSYKRFFYRQRRLHRRIPGTIQRTTFLQAVHTDQKASYSVKLFKICGRGGYTAKVKEYAGICHSRM
uniref:DDE_Tnp_1_7 domain-containing protein n=1 Tax=Haemonchus contortus TaxID=6289 RepID=A0A7I4YHV7_HAECO